MATSLMRQVRYPHAKARRVIGYDPRISLEDGIESLRRWYRETYLPTTR